MEINYLQCTGRHGNRWSKSVDLAMRNFKMDCTSVDADLFMCGHNHYGSFSSEYVRTPHDGSRKYYCFTGSFLSYDGSYAQDKSMNKTPESFVHLELDRNCNVNCRVFNVDEV